MKQLLIYLCVLGLCANVSAAIDFNVVNISGGSQCYLTGYAESDTAKLLTINDSVIQLVQFSLYEGPILTANFSDPFCDHNISCGAIVEDVNETPIFNQIIYLCTPTSTSSTTSSSTSTISSTSTTGPWVPVTVTFVVPTYTGPTLPGLVGGSCMPVFNNTGLPAEILGLGLPNFFKLLSLLIITMVMLGVGRSAKNAQLGILMGVVTADVIVLLSKGCVTDGWISIPTSLLVLVNFIAVIYFMTGKPKRPVVEAS
jgi:hypothetical protein